MTGSNLPPGCSLSDIPGNRPEDFAIVEAEEKLMDICATEHLTPDEYMIVAKIGIIAVKEARDLHKKIYESHLAGEAECKDVGICPLGCGECDRKIIKIGETKNGNG